MKNISSKIEQYFVVIPLLFVVLIKVPHLALPYYWDEAWSYFPAVFKMYENGPGLLPGALPLWDAKGHPLFFFFLGSLWMKIGGTSVLWMHILPLLISLGTLLAIYSLVKRIVNIKAANIAVLLFGVQSLFLAQATMLLPEMLVTLLLVLSINFYLLKKFWLFVVSASLMVMTKETTIVFAGGFMVYHLLDYLKPGKEARKYILENILLMTPLLVYAIFLLLHKKEFGTYFFSDHMGYIQISSSSILNKLQIATGIIFTRYGRNIILLAVIVALIYLLIKKKKIAGANLLGLILLQTVLFLLFSVINFYTQRYMLVLLALFMIAAGILIEQLRFKKQWILTGLIAILVVVSAIYSFTKKSNSDSDLGYVQSVKIQRQMARYCEEKGWQNKPIAASFNMIFALRNPNLGFLSGDKAFTAVTNWGKFRETEILLNESTFYDFRSELDTVKKEDQLIKEFHRQHAWGEVYEKTHK